MIEKAENKKIGKKDTEIKKVSKKSKKTFFYPDYSLSIQAESKEEADKKLLEIIKK